MKEVQTRKNRSGSNNRQRQLLLGARVSPEEMLLVQQAAHRSGEVSVAKFVRDLTLREAREALA